MCRAFPRCSRHRLRHKLRHKLRHRVRHTIIIIKQKQKSARCVRACGAQRARDTHALHAPRALRARSARAARNTRGLGCTLRDLVTGLLQYCCRWIVPLGGGVSGGAHGGGGVPSRVCGRALTPAVGKKVPLCAKKLRKVLEILEKSLSLPAIITKCNTQ